MKKKSLTKLFWIVLLFFPITVMLINIIVDPFWYFNLINIPFLNQNKPQFANEARMAKAQHICRQRPSNIILGGSRAELGLSTTHPAWQNYPGVTYNIGLAGTGIWEMNKTLQHAYYASGRLKLAVVGIDFLMFNRKLEDIVFDTVVIGFDKNRLMLSPTSRCSTTFSYDIDKLLGYQALKNSYESVVRYLNIKPTSHVDYRSDGRMQFTFRTAADIAAQKALLASKKYKTFTPKKDYTEQYGQEIAFVNKTWRAGPDKTYCFTDADGNHSTFEDYRDMLRFAHEHHIDLRLFISPEHANMMIAMQEAGLWIMFEDWKKQLVQLNEDIAKEFKTKPFEIWDFSGFNAITTVLKEDVFNSYYWEPSHYKETVGNMILDVILGKKKSQHGFGTLLSSTNLQKHLDDTITAGKIYAQNDYVVHLKMAIADIFKESTGSTCGFHNELLYKAGETTDPALAQTYLADALKKYKQEVKRYNERGMPYMETTFIKKYLLAQKGHAVPRPLKSWQLYQERGIEKMQQNNWEAAIIDFTEAIEKGPKNLALHYLRGTSYVQINKNSDAINDFKIILALEPNNKTVQSLLKQAEKAFADNKTYPVSWIVYQQRGIDKTKHGDLMSAIADFTKAIHLAPRNTALYYLRGSTYTQLGEHTNAIHDFKNILASDPKNKTVQLLLKQSEEQLSKTSNNLTSWVMYQAHGIEKATQGNLTGAILDFTKAIELEPKNPALYYLRGSALAKLSQTDRAIHDFKTILKLDPKNKTVQTLLKQSEDKLLETN